MMQLKCCPKREMWPLLKLLLSLLWYLGRRSCQQLCLWDVPKTCCCPGTGWELRKSFSSIKLYLWVWSFPFHLLQCCVSPDWRNLAPLVPCVNSPQVVLWAGFASNYFSRSILECPCGMIMVGRHVESVLFVIWEVVEKSGIYFFLECVRLIMRRNKRSICWLH